MKSRDFVYWLQGFFEITDGGSGNGALTLEQITIVKNHLNLVFKHEIDPAMGTQQHQNELNAVHAPMFDPNKPIVRC